MRREIVHKVKKVGDDYAICGMPLINNGIYATQEGKFNCKECLRIDKLAKEFNTPKGMKEKLK